MALTETPILVDCNVFIEASRVGAINVLLGHYKVITPEKCIEEAASGNVGRRDYIEVDLDNLKSKVTAVTVSDMEKAHLTLSLQGRVDLDPGEEELLAYAYSHPGETYIICSPDGACVRAGFLLGMIDSYISLEELLERAGSPKSLRNNYTKSWMESVRTKLSLETI